MAILPGFGRVVLDFGAIRQLGEQLASIGLSRPLLVTDPSLAALGLIDKARDGLLGSQQGVPFGEADPHPIVASVEAIAAAYKANGCDVMVAMGGGSIIDSCKAAAVLTGNPPPLIQYSGHPEKVTGSVAPIVAMPTTAGTGSEVSRGAGIHPRVGEREFSAGGDFVLPRIAICDPELTLSLSPKLTAGTGMDALVHCMEGFLSPTVNPIVDAIALDGIRRVCTYIERAVNDGTDREARWQMMLAATEGGMAIAKGLGMAHTLSMALSDTPVHHGAVVSVSMPVVLRYVADRVPDKLDALAWAMNCGGDKVAAAVEALNDRVGLPRTFRGLGYEKNDFDELAAYSTRHWFNTTSPKKPTEADFREVITELLA